MDIREITKDNISKLYEMPLREDEDENIEHLCLVHFKRFGQLKIPIICVVDGRVRVVDGLKYMKTISKATEFVKVNYVGKLSLFDFYVLRLYVNFSNQRTHFINIAKVIREIIERKGQLQDVANKTNLTPIEVERYHELLAFDWEAFRRTEIQDTNQITMF